MSRNSDINRSIAERLALDMRRTNDKPYRTAPRDFRRPFQSAEDRAEKAEAALTIVTDKTEE